MTVFLKCLNINCLETFFGDQAKVCPKCGIGELSERTLSEITPSELRLLLREELELSKSKSAK